MLTNLLGAEAYGTYAYAITWLAVIAIPTLLGLDHITLRYVAAYREKADWGHMSGLLRFSFYTAIATSVLIAAIAGGYALIWLDGASGVKFAFVVSMLVLPIVVLSQIRQSVVRGLDRPILAQLPENIVYPALLVAILLLLHWRSAFPLTSSTAVLANSLAWVGTFVVGGALLQIALPKQLKGVEPGYERADWLRMMPPLLLAGPAYQLLNKGDLLVLGALRPAAEVGVYAVASRAAEQLTTVFYTAAGLAGASIFSRIYATGDKEELQSFILLVTRSIFWLSLPLYAAVMVFAPTVLALYGSEFTAGAWVLRLLSTTYFVSTLSGFIIIMLYNTGHARDVAITMGSMALLNIGLSIFLVQKFGMFGAALSSGGTLVLLHGALVVVLYRRTGVLSLPLKFNSGR